RMPIAGDPLRPLVFAIVLGWVGSILNAIWNLAFRGAMPKASTYGMPDYVVPMTALFAPVLIVCAVLVSGAIHHVMLIIVGGAKSGFVATMRVVCYSQAPQVLQLLPGCGVVLAGVGSLLLAMQGLAVAHRISLGK